MKLAYILLVHRNVDQVNRLIRRLAGDDSLIVVHVDRRSPIAEDLARKVSDVPRVLFARRVACHWGAFGIVQACVEALRALAGSGLPFDRAVLLSGQDYPIKSNRALQSFLSDHPLDEFIESFPLHEPNRWTKQGGPYQAQERVERWHLRIRGRMVTVPLIRRNFLKGLVAHGGSQWWCLTRPCIDHVLKAIQDRPELLTFFRHTFIPDECFFQTMVSNSPFGAHVRGDGLHFVDWDHPNPAVPATLLKGDLDRLRISPKFWARKFDAGRDSDILDLLDHHCGSESSDP